MVEKVINLKKKVLPTDILDTFTKGIKENEDMANFETRGGLFMYWDHDFNPQIMFEGEKLAMVEMFGLVEILRAVVSQMYLGGYDE